MVLAGYYDAEGRRDEALATYRKALELQADDVRIKQAVARFYYKNKEIDNAEKTVAEILEKRPNYFPTRVLKGEILTSKRQFDDAITLFGQLMKEEPNNARIYYFKGLAHLGQGETRLGRADVAKAVELNPRFIKAKLLLAELYFRDRDYVQAQKESESVLALQPTNLRARLIQGNSFMYQKKHAEAQKIFEDIIATYPDNPVGYYRLGLVNRLQKQNDLAMQNFKKALDLNPNLMDVFTNVVLMHAAQKDLQGALKACDQQLTKVGDNRTAKAMIYNLKGGVYLAMRNTKDAEAAYKKALVENPNYLPPYTDLARIYLANDRVIDAIAQFQTALDKNPNQTGPHMLLGTIFDMQKRTDLSEKHYRAALDVDPNFAPAANNLAWLLANRGENLNEALDLAQRAKAKFPDNPNIIDTLGWVYYKKELYDNAVTEFSDAVEKQPNNSIMRYHLGLAYYKKGENDKARQELEKALSLNQTFDGADEAKRILGEL
jgi:tetratricopeptide (TPR) repeat protein